MINNMRLFKKPIIDDKGNKVPELSIVRDTSNNNRMFYVITSFCCVDIKTGKIHTFEEIQKNGYIKVIYKKSNYIEHNKRLKSYLKTCKYIKNK